MRNSFQTILPLSLYFLFFQTGFSQTNPPRLGWQTFTYPDVCRFSPDNKILVTASSRGINVYDVETEKSIQVMKGEGDVRDVKFIKNGMFAVKTENGISVFDVVSGKKIAQLYSGGFYGHSLDINSDGTRIISKPWDIDYPVDIWDTRSWKVISQFRGNDAVWSPNGEKLLISSRYKDTLRLTDAITKKVLWLKTRESSLFNYSELQFSKDGRKVVILKSFKKENGDSIRNDQIEVIDASNGKKIFSFINPEEYESVIEVVTAANYIATMSRSSIWRIIDILTGKSFPVVGHIEKIDRIEFSLNGDLFVTSSDKEYTSILWDSRTAKQIAKFEGRQPTFSTNSELLATCTDNSVNIWNPRTGVKVRSISGEKQVPLYGILPLDSNRMVSVSENHIDIQEIQTGKLVSSFGIDPINSIDRILIGPNGKQVITTSSAGIKIWDSAKGLLKNQIDETNKSQIKLSPDGRTIAMVNGRRTIQICDIESKSILKFPGLEEEAKIESLEFNSNGSLLVSANSDSTAVVWDVIKGIKKTTLFADISEIEKAKFVDNDSKIVTLSNNDIIRLFDVKTGHSLKSVTHLGAGPLVYHETTKRLVSIGDTEVKVWKIPSLDLERTIYKSSYWEFKFSPDGQYLLSPDGGIWEIASGKKVRDQGGLIEANFSLDSKIIFGVRDTRQGGAFIDTEIGARLLEWTRFDSTDLISTHPSGLFDATRSTLSKLYFVQDLDIIEFGQLKERYYEPGLWKKVMSGAKLRNVVGMKSIELPPDIRVGQVDEKGFLPIELTNKGGGIGEVTILINGKEAIADARPKGSNSKTARLSLKAYIGNNKALIKGSANFIAVKAWNEGHWVVSRASGLTYSIEGNEQAYKPAIHIITSGVSDYTGTELDLKYAAKDAEDVSKALQLGAKKLFGTERSYIYNLTTSQPTNQYPTKANILKTFEKVSSVAHPLDVVVVYLSGHGINHGGQDGDWYYLTQDAYTSSSSAYNDPEIRRTSTVSSNELVELFKKVPALKQVLMIDACASGKVVENLMAKKDIESTTLRALDRMRDRTGLHIITGCTADAVSYEASKYGQGVLTYSLLEGIRGAALREDQFVDINKLFQYAHDRVPTLAEGIGGIQTPQVFSPQGGQSFDIGVLGDIEKKEIPIAKIRPVYIRSAFIDDDQLEDALQLGKKVDDALNEAASKGTGSSIIFVDVRDYPEGCKLSGKYKQEGGIIKLKLRKKCEGKDETIEIEGKTVEEVRGKILSSL